MRFHAGMLSNFCRLFGLEKLGRLRVCSLFFKATSKCMGSKISLGAMSFEIFLNL